MKFLTRIVLFSCWILIGWALVSPFISLQEPTVAEDWHKPDRLAALSLADRQKVQQRLAYPDPEPVFIPLPDFNQFIDVTEKKLAFFDYLRPYVQRENNRLFYLREQLLQLSEKKLLDQRLSVEEYAFIYSLYDEFRLEVATSDMDSFRILLRRVDMIPESLVLMQAANESAWGTSRFAVEGYNFFGQWCFRTGCGLVPLNRGEDQYHEVARFSSPGDAIRGYFYNLNTFHTYQHFRQLRASLRLSDQPLQGEALAEGLGRYSERGEEYISEISDMIRFNLKLMDLDE